MPYGINPIAVVAGIVVMMVLGYLWYGPLFGRMWATALGKNYDDLGSPTTGIVVSILASIVTTLVLAVLIGALGARGDAVTGAVWGLLMAAGLVGTATLTNGVYEGKPVTVTGLFIAYQLVALGINGAIQAAIR